MMNTQTKIIFFIWIAMCHIGGVAMLRAQNELKNELVQSKLTVNRTHVLQIKSFPKSLANGRLFAGRNTLLALAESGAAVPNCATLCQLYLQRDVRQSLGNTNQVWFDFVNTRAELALTNKALLIWTEPKEFVQAYRDVSRGNGSKPPPPRKTTKDSPPSTSSAEKCECDSQVCIEPDGTASFSFECNGVGFTVGTKGEFSLSVGKRASAEVVVIGSEK